MRYMIIILAAAALASCGSSKKTVTRQHVKTDSTWSQRIDTAGKKTVIEQEKEVAIDDLAMEVTFENNTTAIDTSGHSSDVEYLPPVVKKVVKTLRGLQGNQKIKTIKITAGKVNVQKKETSTTDSSGSAKVSSGKVSTVEDNFNKHKKVTGRGSWALYAVIGIAALVGAYLVYYNWPSILLFFFGRKKKRDS